MRISAAVFVTLALSTGMAQAATATAPAPTLGNWSVTKTFHPEGSPTCVLRFPSIKGEPALSLDEREKGGATLTLSALPPFLAGEKGVIRGIGVAVGDWSQADLKGNWVRGSDDTNSRITVPLEMTVAAIGPRLARGKLLTISFELASGDRSFPFTLAGSVAPTAEIVDCK